MLEPQMALLAAARHAEPHALLGVHLRAARQCVLLYLPAVQDVHFVQGPELKRVPDTDFFAWDGAPDTLPAHYRLEWTDSAGAVHSQVDPYCFLPTIDEQSLAAFNAGTHRHAWHILGAQLMNVDGIDGTRFSVWAPNAQRVSLVGPFCGWDGRRYPLRRLGGSGVWELFVPGLDAGTLYKYEILAQSGALGLRSDPYGRGTERRPSTASLVVHSTHQWGDEPWLSARRERDWLHAPMSIYEVHPGSWRQHPDGSFYS